MARGSAEGESDIEEGFLVRSLNETEDLGRRIASALKAGDTIALEGDLGAGKTTLARAILRALGVTGEVPSPSFTLVQQYDTPQLQVAHYDFYRIADPAEVDELGLEDAIGDGAVLVEWPERAPGRIPRDALRIRIGILGENERAVQFSGPARWARMISDGKAGV
ncbi:MAG TPA: tRNA (adenosine(37)-N6)-threonylcarbamoyltransferase complex ATPase subunit type 1 TsaE [Rhizomicrobium sp.]|jgi:tRNA threonylcarbamoyl adenosine modification protein YjeE|nr:tRNA (adenosine(37)-N6)-threonylcarbamoyltransferase complex ATPase subunit type 1 TsaE [Rhizomicrobium sp.]